MVQARGQFKQLLLASIVLVVGTGISLGASALTERQAESNAQHLFERDADSAIAEIEREIERHVAVVEETVAFAEATWPGSLNEWREFTDGRVTGGTNLAFSSTAGVIERVPADQIAEFEARESSISGDPFQIVELAPLPPEADRHVLTRTAEDSTNGFQIRGLEISPVSEFLDIGLPGTSDGIAVDSIDEAPEAFLQILSIENGEFDENAVLDTTVLLSSAIGSESEPPLGWIIVPARLSELLTRAIDSLPRTDVNLAIEIPDTEVEGDLGRYEGQPGLLFDTAALARESSVDFGGWNWRVKVWAGEGFGIDENRIEGRHVFFVGMALTLLLAGALQAQWRYRRKLVEAEFESELQRTLAETDRLTGLLNRRGVREFAMSDSIQAIVESDGCATFFLDLDGFKQVNDELGHAAGDKVLVSVGRAVSAAARDGDVVGRLGGDEFVVFCPGLCDETAADALADRLTAAIVDIDGPKSLGVSVGTWVTKPGTAFDLENSLSKADSAMYAAKRERRSGANS